MTGAAEASRAGRSKPRTALGRAGGARGLALFVQALRLAWSAQRLRRGEDLPRTARRLPALTGLPRGVRVEEANLAAGRAAARLARWVGALDSCLVRSLVVGALLSDRAEVRLHLGVRVRGERPDPFDAHAWVTVDGRVASTAGPDPPGGVPFSEIVALPLVRPSRSARVADW